MIDILTRLDGIAEDERVSDPYIAQAARDAVTETRRLRKALEEIAEGASCGDYYCGACGCVLDLMNIATDALKAGEEEE